MSLSLIFAPTAAQAQSVLNLPVPGTMVAPSPIFIPVLLKGMTIDPQDPLKFDFIVDSGEFGLPPEKVKKESEKLVKYFLASMTIPEDDLWVNLSPYEQERIIPQELGKTDLGRDMLAQDYLLKQLTASLMYPEKELGKKFWDKVYSQARDQFGTSEIPVDTFNKVWILPDVANVYEHNQTVYITDTHLKVMLDSDYEARQTSTSSAETSVSKQIIKDIIIPEIEREVNTGQHFAQLRQIYNSLILAKWYKETVKNTLLEQVYIDQKKINGIELEDSGIKDQVYDQYMAAYKKGVFNYIKEDYDRLSGQMIPRKYFSGGELFRNVSVGTGLASAVRPDGDSFRISVRDRSSSEIRAQAAASPVITAQDVQTLKANAQKYFSDQGISYSDDLGFQITEALAASIRIKPARKLKRKLVIEPGQLRIALQGDGVLSDALDGGKLVKELVRRLKLEENQVRLLLRNAPRGFAVLEEKSITEPTAASPVKLDTERLRRIDAAIEYFRDENKLALTDDDVAYLKTLYRKYIEGAKQLKIDANFIPSARFNSDERREIMGVYNSKDLADDEENKATAQDVNLHVIEMKGGLGTSFQRLQTLKRLTGRTEIADKSADTYFEEVPVNGFDEKGEPTSARANISVAELKTLQSIFLAKNGVYKNIEITELVNKASLKPVRDFYDSDYLDDRVDKTLKESDRRSYRKVIADTEGVELNPKMIIQGDLPVVDPNSEEKEFIDHADAVAPGSHGFLAMNLLNDIADGKNYREGQHDITTVVNGDGVNNFPTNDVVGWMARRRIPIIMITTTRTAIDAKGGILGAEMTGDGLIAQIFEKAQAENAGQFVTQDGKPGIFQLLGLTEGEIGGQLFNTNISLLNNEVLHPFLKELKKAIGSEKFFEIITPDLITNPKKKKIGEEERDVYQLEGAKGSALLNLNKFVLSPDKDVKEKVERLMKKYNLDRLVYFVNFDADVRTEVFTPVKYAWDHVLFDHSDLFTLNTETMRLERQQGDNVNMERLPGFDLGEYYKDVEHVIAAFGDEIGARELEYLSIRGKVHFPNAILKGQVAIESASEKIIDLNKHKNLFPTDSEGRIILNNVKVTVDEQGRIVVGKNTSSSPVTDVGGIDMNDITVERQGDKIEIQFDPVKVQSIIENGFDGYSPVIINMTPLPNVLPLLGLEPKKEEDFELVGGKVAS